MFNPFGVAKAKVQNMECGDVSPLSVRDRRAFDDETKAATSRRTY